MINLLDKRTSLYIQIKNDLIKRIKSGEIPPSSKLPSERELAETLGVSRSTAKQAIQELETEGYIERIPTRGSFVRNLSEGKLKQTNIILAFPEESISIEKLNYANWAADSEYYRGMMASSGKYNLRVTFQHFEDSEEKGIIQKQVKDIMEFDGAVFIGHQLSFLKRELQKAGIPLVSIDTQPLPEKIGALISYNRAEAIAESARFLVDSGYKKMGIIYPGEDDRPKVDICLEIFRNGGCECRPDWILSVDRNEEKAYWQLKRALSENLNEVPEAFFCASQIYSFALIGIAAERGWKIPDDIGIFGYSNNMALRPTVPSLTHLYVPHFEMGMEACRALSENYLMDRILQAKIIKGKTTKSRG